MNKGTLMGLGFIFGLQALYAEMQGALPEWRITSSILFSVSIILFWLSGMNWEGDK